MAIPHGRRDGEGKPEEGMNIAEAQEILDRITYKPGWKIQMTNFGVPRLEIEYATIDALNPNRSTRVTFQKAIELHYLNQKGFLFFVRLSIEQAEEHETREWLKFNGRCLTDPHPPRADMVPV